jgi:hypothetical protein
MLMPDIHFCFAVTSGDYGEAGTIEFLKDFHRRRFILDELIALVVVDSNA